jgi:hypothetical protein
MLGNFIYMTNNPSVARVSAGPEASLAAFLFFFVFFLFIDFDFGLRP